MRYVIFFLLLLLSFSTFSEEIQKSIQIDNPWVRTIPPRLDRTAAFMEIRNFSDQDVVLERAASPQFAYVELHRTETDPLSGVSRMIGQKEIIIPAKSLLAFKPGDYHIMLIVPTTEVKEGDSVDLELFFKDQPSIQVQALVTRIPVHSRMPMPQH